MSATNLLAKPRHHATVTIESIDRELAGRYRFLRFAPELERAYEEDQRVDRTIYSTYCTAIGMLVYNAFLIADWQMIPDVFVESCIHRLGIVTPLAALAYVVWLRCTSHQVREALISLMAVVCVAFMMKTMTDSRSEYVPSYCNGTILVMTFSVLVQRAPIRHAVASCSAMDAIQLLSIRASPMIDSQMFIANVVFFVSGSALLLTVAYALEREGRHSYLLAIRSRLLNQQLDLTTKVDPLTGLWNRRQLEAVMDAAWAEPTPRPMAVILLDLDQFKPFNDTYGHMAGDRCLQRIASCLTAPLADRPAFAVRFGGEEFLVFLPGLDERSAVDITERLRDAIRIEAVPHPILGEGAIVSASFGVAAGRTSSVTPAALIASADKALYRAKAEGRDCVRAAIGEMSEAWAECLAGSALPSPAGLSPRLSACAR